MCECGREERLRRGMCGACYARWTPEPCCGEGEGCSSPDCTGTPMANTCRTCGTPSDPDNPPTPEQHVAVRPSRREAWVEAMMTWPSLRVEVSLFPWSWRPLPRGWYDYSPRTPGHAGWWGATAEWLAFKVDFGFNLPPFEAPSTYRIPPAQHEAQS